MVTTTQLDDAGPGSDDSGGENYTDSWFEHTRLTPNDVFRIAAIAALALSATRLYLEVKQV